MSFKKYSVAAAIALAMSAGSAMAAGSDTGTITFHGLVNNNTCKISIDNKIDQNGNDFDITLGTVNVADFGTQLGADSTLGATNFTLNVSECSDSTLKDVNAQFDSWAGSSSTEGGMLVPPSNLEGAAANVNLVLSNNGNGNRDQVMIDQVNNLQKADIKNGAADLYYRVAYVQGQGWDATSNPVSAGTVQAQVAFTVAYN
ncbi:fimbrial assembly protein [Salmonella enterica subsp. salamae]|nr:fimbrial assembly protein [Salmonella enterica subsp. salamae]ECJ2279884.1 fimbrial assembly protein [Salmonella enterica subsp. salamae]HCC0887289.1 fimbrial protein [Salmonella enterica]